MMMVVVMMMNTTAALIFAAFNYDLTGDHQHLSSVRPCSLQRFPPQPAAVTSSLHLSTCSDRSLIARPLAREGDGARSRAGVTSAWCEVRVTIYQVSSR